MEKLTKDKMKRISIMLLGILIIWLCLVIFLSLDNGYFDLKISSSIAMVEENSRYSRSLFARIFESVGEFPIYLFIMFIINGFIYLLKDNKKLNIVLSIILYISSAFVGAFMFHRVEAYVSSYKNENSIWTQMFNITIILNLLLGGIVTFLFYLLFNYLKFDSKSLLRLLIVMVITLAISQFIVHIVLKPIFSRNRYRALLFLDQNLDNFKPWYLIGNARLDIEKAIKDDFKSFPSGHTAAASTTFFLMIFPYYLINFKEKKYNAIFTIIPIVYTITVAVSRVIAGAHYTTDVLFGFMIFFFTMWIVFFVERYLYNNKKEIGIK